MGLNAGRLALALFASAMSVGSVNHPSTVPAGNRAAPPLYDGGRDPGAPYSRKHSASAKSLTSERSQPYTEAELAKFARRQAREDKRLAGIEAARVRRAEANQIFHETNRFVDELLSYPVAEVA